MSVSVVHSSNSINSKIADGMKIDSPGFDIKHLIKLDFNLDLSMIQTAISYILKTSALHDKEIIELR
jgi:hypothetical protein